MSRVAKSVPKVTARCPRAAFPSPRVAGKLQVPVLRLLFRAGIWARPFLPEGPVRGWQLPLLSLLRQLLWELSPSPARGGFDVPGPWCGKGFSGFLWITRGCARRRAASLTEGADSTGKGILEPILLLINYPHHHHHRGGFLGLNPCILKNQGRWSRVGFRRVKTRDFLEDLPARGVGVPLGGSLSFQPGILPAQQLCVVLSPVLSSVGMDSVPRS